MYEISHFSYLLLFLFRNMSDENYKRQDDELDALKCIYEHQFIRSNGEGKSGGQLLVIVNLSKEFQISYPAAKLEKQDEE